MSRSSDSDNVCLLEDTCKTSVVKPRQHIVCLHTMLLTAIIRNTQLGEVSPLSVSPLKTYKANLLQIESKSVEMSLSTPNYLPITQKPMSNILYLQSTHLPPTASQGRSTHDGYGWPVHCRQFDSSVWIAVVH